MTILDVSVQGTAGSETTTEPSLVGRAIQSLRTGIGESIGLSIAFSAALTEQPPCRDGERVLLTRRRGKTAALLLLCGVRIVTVDRLMRTSSTNLGLRMQQLQPSVSVEGTAARGLGVRSLWSEIYALRPTRAR